MIDKNNCISKYGNIIISVEETYIRKYNSK